MSLKRLRERAGRKLQRPTHLKLLMTFFAFRSNLCRNFDNPCCMCVHSCCPCCSISMYLASPLRHSVITTENGNLMQPSPNDAIGFPALRMSKSHDCRRRSTQPCGSAPQSLSIGPGHRVTPPHSFLTTMQHSEVVAFLH